MSFIFRPGDPQPSAELGGKAGALAVLHGQGLPVPEWFVLLPQSFEASLGHDGQRAFSQAISSGMDLEPIVAKIQPTPQVLRELMDALTGLCPAGELVAVRSSAHAEDGHDFSFAGQFESFLFVKREDVPGKVIGVWKSAFSDRIRIYCERHQLARPTHPPAVLIQRMVHAESAGVAFGADPVTGRRDLTVVSAVHGLGTALVDGESDADSWHVDRSGKMIQSKVARK
ncbi:MAG: phosphoenolpyruvate synthase, partial [Verrucomicrobiota bacterium]|nr:phosphoenolpyruvate synthase [Verrucomicrobiota bacterium]